MESAAHDSIFFNGTLVHVVQYSLKYPEAHAFLDDFKSSLSLVYHPETQLHAVILDFAAVEYLDYTGVQTLLAAKDVLADIAGHGDEIPLHFANMRTSHLNRLMRVANHNLPATDPDSAGCDGVAAAPAAPAITASVAAVPAARMVSSSPSPTVMTDSDVVPSRSRRPSGKQGGFMASLSSIGRSLSIGGGNGSATIKKSKSSSSISGACDDAASSVFTPTKTSSGVFDQEMPAANVRALKYFHSSLDDALRAVVA
ncbi:hypothetical protein HDU83_007752 [Entophlyctis luteolus]|nr:hypothetical protein HDU82_001758 [Entophlyctis luteolus]KAJ3352682.1 hypothetical protein HDU83_007752 [Entophlyctis luteolus]KAJ3378130.1 hypothetical protein HDU84_007908 [Entophlyctis sp. JEL0112]